MFRTIAIPKVYHRWWLFLVAFLLGLLIQEAMLAQTTRHYLTNGHLPPGVASERALRSNPEHFGHVQLVKIITPDDSKVSFWVGNGYAVADTQGPIFEMTMGPVYRVKVTNIRQHPGVEIYPSIELLSRLHPPQGKESEFPVPVVITEDDLEQAIAGKMVTKVVYLEDPETALPFQQMGDRQRNIDISGYEDPLHTAHRLGRPMAIVRLGSRQPMATDRMGAFEFNGPALRMMGTQMDSTPAMQNQSRMRVPRSYPQSQNQYNQQTGLPPIVPGFQKASHTMGDKK